MAGIFVPSERNKSKRIHEGFVYTFSKRTKDEANGIWVCEKRNTCNGRIWTQGLDGRVVKIVTSHTHAPDATRPEALQILGDIRERAITTQEQPQQIVATAVQAAHENVRAHLPAKESLKRTIRNVRNHNGAPRLPATLEELVIPQVIYELLHFEKSVILAKDEDTV